MKNNKYVNTIVPYILMFLATIVVLISVGLVASLLFNTVKFFSMVSLFEFFTSKEWTPLFADAHYGIYPLFVGTILVVTGAILIAIPVGLMTAIYLSEYAPHWLAKILKPILEILSGIPTIVYGFFALTVITPFIQSIVPNTQFYNSASASIAMGFMIVPLVSSLSQDALNAVPNQMRTGGYALGLTKWEVMRGILLPSARSGIVASIILAISRAIGETMIVAIAAGIQPSTSWNPFESIMTLTGYISLVAQSDAPSGTTAYYALYAVGLILFLSTLLLNLLGRSFIKRRVGSGNV
jgi:phosphate transport system permease protein